MSTKSCLVCDRKFDPKVGLDGRPIKRGNRNMCDGRCRAIYSRGPGYSSALRARRNPQAGVLVTLDHGAGSLVHAVAPPNHDGARYSVCNRRGRFIPIGATWQSWGSTTGRPCPDCLHLLPVEDVA